jgi:branched-chain amino acid transport system substrate-binding protein
VLALAAACSSSSSTAAGGGTSSSASASAASCTTSIGMEAPITGPAGNLGMEQLHFAQLAVQMDNAANHTNITLVQGDTQLDPKQATTVTQQFVSNNGIVAVVGPAGSNEVIAVGPAMGRAGLAFISGSATRTDITAGANPTFLRVVSNDKVQGAQDANYIIKNLKPKALMIIDDQEAYSTGLVDTMTPILQQAGIKVDHESISQKLTDFASIIAKVTPDTSVIVTPWQVASQGQQLGRDLQQQHKNAVIFGTDGLFDTKAFTISGSYVSAFGPDITQMPADASLVQQATSKYGTFGTFGPPSYEAAHVIDEAIASVCKAGQTPSRANVLAAIKSTNDTNSILGNPIAFDSHGDVVNGKFYLFKIDASGKYNLVPTS